MQVNYTKTQQELIENFVGKKSMPFKFISEKLRKEIVIILKNQKKWK